MELLIALCGGICVYSLIAQSKSADAKKSAKNRFAKYLKNIDIDDVQRQFFKEKLNKNKLSNSQKFQIASKQFNNYLAMSGVKLSGTEFIGGWAFLTLVPMLIVLLVGGSAVTAFALAIVGFAVPPIIVQSSQKKRQQQFNKQLSGSITIMGNCIRAGFSFQQAMESIANEMQPPISTEFATTLREMKYGVSMEEALNHMVERVRNKDLDLLVSAVLTSMQVGGNLSDILEIISDTINDRLKIKSQIRVLTASGRMSGIIIGLLPIFIILIMMVINPGYFQGFFETGIGKAMIIVSIFLEALGFFVINKIVGIKY